VLCPGKGERASEHHALQVHAASFLYIRGVRRHLLSFVRLVHETSQLPLTRP